MIYDQHIVFNSPNTFSLVNGKTKRMFDFSCVFVDYVKKTMGNGNMTEGLPLDDKKMFGMGNVVKIR